jgi:signal transduction histidine kinase/ActR/RegA family two-component response regulator/PAS domain-containing protein
MDSIDMSGDADNALLPSLDEFELLKGLEDAWVILDRQTTRILFRNAAFDRWFEVCNTSSGGSSPPSSEAVSAFLITPGLIEKYQQVLSTGKAAVFKHQWSPDAPPLQIQAVPFRHGIGLQLREVYAQKLATAPVSESHERHQTLFERMDSGYCVMEVLFDESGKAIDCRFLESNPAFEKHTGFAPAPGDRLRELVPALEPQWFETYGRVATTGEEEHFEIQAATLNRWFNVLAYRTGNPDSHLVVALFRDITVTKQASVTLQRRNELLFLLSESAHDLLAATDSQLLVHQLFAKVAPTLGLDIFFNFMVDASGEHLYLDACHGVGPEVEESFKLLPFGEAICGTVAQQGTRMVVNHVQHCAIDKAASVKDMGVGAYACHPLRVGDRLIGTLSFGSRSRNTFEDEELEFMQTLASYVAMAKERLRVESDHFNTLCREQAASQAKDRFLAVLSHELRTPLTPVLMTVAARESDPEMPAALREELTMIRRNIELETKLIDDLLDLSRITTGKLSLQLQRVDLNSIIHQVCAICRPQIEDKQLRLELELHTASGHIQADPARLQQIIWNLLKNAVKFTPPQGLIRISTTPAENGFTRITVQDTGLGMDSQVLPNIFDAFQQGDPSITQQFGGMGLGLAITKAIVDLHHGSIDAFSDGPGLGSRFTVELPSAPQQTPLPSPPLPSNETTDIAVPRLLLAEDHADTARILCILLKRAGYIVHRAANVAEAIELAACQPFDILVSDLGLPDASGYDLMRELRRHYSFPGIAMSGYGMEDDMQKSREAGFSEHLIKPVTIDQLKQAITRVLNHDKKPGKS